MGCDSHILIQVFDPATKTWQLVKSEPTEDAEDDENYTLHAVPDDQLPVCGVPTKDNEDEVYEKFDEDQCGFWFGTSRDYVLFAKIADVRNEYGLLDVLQPRGVPEDLSERVKSIFGVIDDGMGRHSRTWLLPEDIEHLFLAECPVMKSMFYLHVDQYEKLKKRHPNMTPETVYLHAYDVSTSNSACGFIYTPSQWDEMTDAQRTRERSRRDEYYRTQGKDHIYIEVVWSQKREFGGVKEIKELLKRVQTTFPDKQVRFLVNFDS